MPPRHRIVIVGGGTAGWMTANLMARRWGQKAAEIVLVESPEIGIIGVGEGSTPTLKRFFQDMGIPETEWMPACHATYKVSIRFVDWSPASGVKEYAHPFLSQLDVFSEQAFYANCYARRQGVDVLTQPEKFLFNGWLAARQCAPLAPSRFPFRIDYGYHFDSALLGQFLRQKALALGVAHLPLTVTAVAQHPDGRISQLHTAQGQVVAGDFFIDCTGFRAELLQKTLGVPFESFKDNLFNDAAVVFPTAPLDSLPVETRATALSAGWAWQIPLRHRTGNGYVYSTTFLEPTKAEHELRQHLGLLDADVSARHLKMTVGQAEQHWYKNCLGLGLAQGFIEPLEATALHLVQTSVEIFMGLYEKGGFTNEWQAKYNQIVHERFERVRDYIVAHYKLNTRDDSEYWRANREHMHLSDTLQQILEPWYRRADLVQTINKLNMATHFGAVSWHCLLAGYGVFPPLDATQSRTRDQFVQAQLEPLFSGCLLNFQPQRELLRGGAADAPRGVELPQSVATIGSGSLDQSESRSADHGHQIA